MIADRGAPGNNGLGHKGLLKEIMRKPGMKEARRLMDLIFIDSSVLGFLIKSFETVS